MPLRVFLMDGTLQSEENSCDETATVLFPCVWAGLSGPGC